MANFLQHNPEMSKLPTAEEYEARIRELEAKLARYQKAMGGLTIAGGGSEMHGNPELQAKWIQKRRNAQGDIIKSQVKRRRELEAENAALKKTMEINSVGREILEAKDKKIEELREALRNK